jgi:hypothetical protein
MRHLAVFCCAAVLVGCKKSEVPPPQDTTSAMAPATAAPTTPESTATISLTNLAGKWKLRTTDKTGGKAVESGLTATADTSGWKLTRPNGKVVPVHVAVEADSIILEPAPYESALKKGVQVRSRMVFRLQGDKLVGSNEARYHLSTGDSVADRPAEAVRAP